MEKLPGSPPPPGVPPIPRPAAPPPPATPPQLPGGPGADAATSARPAGDRRVPGHDEAWLEGRRGSRELAPPSTGEARAGGLERLHARLLAALDGDDAQAVRAAFAALVKRRAGDREALAEDVLTLCPPGSAAAARLVVAVDPAALGELPAPALEALEGADEASLVAAYDLARAREEREEGIMGA